MLLLDGLPLHPLVIHAVVVLLPLAAVGAVLVAARPAWRRAFGVPVLLLALVGVGAVPVAVNTGGDLQAALGGGSPLVQVHGERAGTLLPVAVAFLVLLATTVVLGRRADRAGGPGADGGGVGPSSGTGPSSGVATSSRAATSSRVVALTAVLAAVAGLVVTGLVIWIGHSGSVAVWQGVVS